MDGDVVLFNRQPSLHKISIMAHKVRVMVCPLEQVSVSSVFIPAFVALAYVPIQRLCLQSIQR